MARKPGAPATAGHRRAAAQARRRGWPGPWSRLGDLEARSPGPRAAALFPEEQVLRAMRAMPEETNPQKICSYILALNPPQQEQQNL